MKASLKVILAAMRAAALLVPPAMAKTVHHAKATNILGEARGSAVPYTPYVVLNEGGPYTPSQRVPGFGKNTDFQDGSR